MTQADPVTIPRPLLRCLIAFPSNGRFPINVRLVSLEDAAAAHAEGWWVVGPDPEDEIRLDQWLKSLTFPPDEGCHDE